MSLGSTLKEQMPIERVVAECGECEMELHDSMKSTERSPYLTGEIIEAKATGHKNDTGHDDLQVGLTKTEPVKEIEATITVND